MNLLAVKLFWSRFAKLTEARSAFPYDACVYAQTGPDSKPLRIGKASKGLDQRYHGGNGYSMDAAMHGSGNLIFVASVDKDQCKLVEDELIWQGRKVLIYNNVGKIMPPSFRLTITHCGDSPDFSEFEP